MKRPTTAYLYFVSKYREKIKTNGEPMPKVSHRDSFVMETPQYMAHIILYNNLYGPYCLIQPK